MIDLKQFIGTHTVAGAGYAKGEFAAVFSKLKSDRLTHKFFYQDVEEQNEFEIPFEALSNLKRDHGVKIGGFVFHMGRCGSTVMSQMMRQVPDNIVLAEPDPMNLLFHRRPPDVETQIRDLRTLMNAFAYLHQNQGSQLFVKFSSWLAMHIDVIQAAFPDVPCIFIYRNPVEILASCETNPMPWLNRSEREASASNEIKESGSANTVALSYGFENHVDYFGIRSDLELCARVLGVICKSVAEAKIPVTLVGYDQIPGEVPDILQTEFNTQVSTDCEKRMMEVGKLNVRSRNNLAFQSDSELKQQTATAESRHLADEIISKSMRLLPGLPESVLTRTPKFSSSLVGLIDEEIDKPVHSTEKVKRFNVSW